MLNGEHWVPVAGVSDDAIALVGDYWAACVCGGWVVSTEPIDEDSWLATHIAAAPPEKQRGRLCRLVDETVDELEQQVSHLDAIAGER